MEEVLADLLFGESIWRDVEMVGQLPDGAEVSLLSAFAQTGELEVLKHPLTKRRAHVLVLSQRVRKQPLRATLGHGPDPCQNRADRWEFG